MAKSHTATFRLKSDFQYSRGSEKPRLKVNLPISIHLTDAMRSVLSSISDLLIFVNPNCTTFNRYPIFSTRYSVTCKVFAGYCGTSEIEHGLCVCTVDYPLVYLKTESLKKIAEQFIRSSDLIMIVDVTKYPEVTLNWLLRLTDKRKILDTQFNPNKYTEQQKQKNKNKTCHRDRIARLTAPCLAHKKL